MPRQGPPERKRGGSRAEKLNAGAGADDTEDKETRPPKLCNANNFLSVLPSMLGEMMTKRDFPPIHPGEILLEDFLKPMQISQYHLAQAIGVPPRRINEIVHGKRGITADTALRLGRFFGMEAQFWMNLQTRYDLETTREALADRLDQGSPCPCGLTTPRSIWRP
jgi:antitoxin HigA-1